LEFSIMRRQRVILATMTILSGTILSGPSGLGSGFAATPLPRPSGPYPAATLPTDEPDSIPHTLAETLGIAYETNPQLTGERAHLRSTDENVPAALAGWRPTIVINSSWGSAVGRYDEPAGCGSPSILSAQTSGQYQAACYTNGKVPPNTTTSKTYNAQGQYIDSMEDNRNLYSNTGTITQYLYRGGKTAASTHEAVNNVYAERARLIAEEETVFTDTINAYVTFIEDQQLLGLDRQNEQVLGDELRAINDRFRVGELTRTDVAQAEAALAQAIATRQTAEGNLETARASFVRNVGVLPPADLADPQPLKLPIKTETEAANLAGDNNPTVIADLFNEAQLKDAIDVAFASIGPNLYLQGQGFQQVGQSLRGTAVYGVQGTINLTFPLYQGGSEYAAIRQARQNYQQGVRMTQDARRAAREQAVQAWDTLVAARAATASSRIAVRSAQIAVEGTEREALVGSATTQDVLIQQQNLLSAQITLVQNITSIVTASYGVASAIGRLTAKDLGLAVPLYDETAYYNAVRDRLWGTGDYAVHQPGR
jgi:outer membrane protein